MKKLLLTLAVFLTANWMLNAQNIGINNPNPDASAALDVTSTTQGMLVPRMTASQRGLIASPATGLLVYQTDGTAGFYFYNGTAWASLNGGGGGGDNLGNHTATTDIQLNGNRVTNNGTGGLSVDNSGNATVNGAVKSGQDGTDGELQLYSEQGATDYNYTIKPNAAATQSNVFTLPPDDGTTGQQLTTDGSGNLSWGNAGGVKLVLEASASIGQTINTGVSVTDGTGTIRYDNEITGPTIGTWTSDSVYTVLEAGLYLFNAHVVSLKVTGNIAALSPYAQRNNSSGTVVQRVYGVNYGNPSGFPTQSGNRGEVNAIMQCNVGDTVRIKVSNGNVSISGPIITTGDQPTRLVIVKLI